MHRIFLFTADSDRLNAMHTSTMLLSDTRRSKTLRSVIAFLPEVFRLRPRKIA